MTSRAWRLMERNPAARGIEKVLLRWYRAGELRAQVTSFLLGVAAALAAYFLLGARP